MAGEEKLVFEITAIDRATQVMRQVEAGAKSLEKTWNSLEDAFSAAAAALAIREIVDATVEWERASNRIDAVLRATGGSAGIARRELDQLAGAIAQNTEFSRRQALEAEGNLLKFGNIHDEVFKRALQLSADYASFTGGDMASATQAIGRALADPVAGVRMLQKELGNLTFSEKEYIAQLEANGEVERAQAAVLDIIERKIGGTAAAMNTGMVGALANVKKGWEELLESIGKTDLAQGIAGGLGQLLSDLSHGGANALPSAFATAGSSLGIRAEDVLADSKAKGPNWQQQMDAQLAAQNAFAAKIEEGRDRIREAHARAVPVLQAWNRQLQETTAEETALTLVLQGEARSWSDADKVKLLNLAVEIDRRKALHLVMEAQAAGIRQASEAMRQADEIQEAYLRGARERLEQQDFETGLLGKTAYAQQQLVALREIELRQRQALRALADTDLDPEELQRRQQAIVDASAREKKAVLDSLAARRQAERDWATGARQAFNDYIEHATNAAEQAQFLFTNAFGHMEDALVEFVMTGKLNFRDFANAVLSDLARIIARQAIAGGAGAIGGAGFLGSLLGGGGGGAAAVPPEFLVGHRGGVVGEPGWDSRAVSPLVFAGARRYHGGGLVGDEVPAILQRGETVLPRGVSAGRQLVVQQNIHVGGNVSSADLPAILAAAKRGTMVAIAEERRRNPTGPFG